MSPSRLGNTRLAAVPPAPPHPPAREGRSLNPSLFAPEVGPARPLARGSDRAPRYLPAGVAAIEIAPLDRVAERKRTVLLARHYREAEGLTIIQIAQRLTRSPATVKAYVYDPDCDKAKAVKRRYQGVCAGCGAPTQPRNGKHDPYKYCKTCHPGATATRWTPARICDAIRAWRDRYGRLPTSYDWSRTHARRRGGQALERLDDCDWRQARSRRTTACP